MLPPFDNFFLQAFPLPFCELLEVGRLPKTPEGVVHFPAAAGLFPFYGLFFIQHDFFRGQISPLPAISPCQSMGHSLSRCLNEHLGLTDIRVLTSGLQFIEGLLMARLINGRAIRSPSWAPS